MPNLSNLSNLSIPRLQNADRGLLTHNAALKNNELCGITIDPDNSLRLNAKSIEDLTSQLAALRFLNPNKELKIRGNCKTEAVEVSYYLHTNNLTIFNMFINNHHYKTTKFLTANHFTEYVASCFQSEADDSLLQQVQD